MSKTLAVIIVAILLIWMAFLSTNKNNITGAPPYGESEESSILAKLPWSVWVRPDVPVKVAIQVGHYQNDNLPEELEKLRNNNGAQAGSVTEVEVNLEISNLIAENLRQQGVDVEVLPATIPPEYWADVFLAIHADGSEDRSKSGYKFATSWREPTGNATELIEYLKAEYEPATGLSWDDNITKNMRGYYAFAWWRYEHSIHPMTTPVIIELGFLTNPSDRNLLVNSSEIPARALSDGVMKYLKSKKLIEN